MSVTASEARRNLFPLIEKVNNDRIPVEITSRRGNAVLLSAEEYASLEETAYLLRVPANAKRLIESLQQARVGDRHEHELAECGWDDYKHWLKADRQTLKRINRQTLKRIDRLIDDALRDPTDGIGKPEPLKHLLTGAWSRRITDEHRLVYLVDGDDLVVLQARFHYNK